MLNSFSIFVSASLLYMAYTFKKLQQPLKETKLIIYAHDHFTGPDASAAIVAGKTGAESNVFHFGMLVTIDNPITEGPEIDSKEIGRAQGMYINSALDGKGLHLVFSVMFNDGPYKGSSLEIQGADVFAMKEREISIVSGTGYFRFVKGFAVLETEFMDIPNLKATLKLSITVKHY